MEYLGNFKCNFLATITFRVVCPIIDIIEPDTFKYIESPICIGGFNWGLQFKWDYPPYEYFKTDEDYVRPLKSPTMAGGLFAIRKSFFHELGEYDPGMEIWGAENVEISLRVGFYVVYLDNFACIDMDLRWATRNRAVQQSWSYFSQAEAIWQPERRGYFRTKCNSHGKNLAG